MKKSLIILIALSLIVFTGCGNKAESSVTSESAVTSESTVITESTVTTESESMEEPSKVPEETTVSDNANNSASSNPYADLDFSFVSEDIFGQSISSDIYSRNNLTLVNIFATWCPPCIQELPHLARLNNEFKDQGFTIVGFVTDTKDYATGNLDNDAIDAAKTLYADANVSYPFIVPDDTFLGGLLFVQYVPTSVFLDKNGKMVGDPIVGANSLEGWRQLITERLNSL